MLSTTDKQLILQALECAIELEVTNGNEEYAGEYKELYSKLNDTKWVNVYEVTRHYGGPEEGGWWYDWYECIESIKVGVENAEDIRGKRYEAHKDKEWGNISSVLGGLQIVVRIEDWKAELESKVVPHYE